MNQFIRRTAMLCLTLFISNTISAAILNGDPATTTFNLDACNAWIPTDDNHDFTEFTGTIINTDEITMSVVGGNLYRQNPDENGHSCTTGLNGTNAMCVSADEACLYNPDSEQAVRFNIEVVPTANRFVQLSSLNFYEMAPEVFSWNDGFSFTNNYPTRYALRVLKNGEVIYQATDVQATQDWTLEEYQFTGDDFKVGVPTIFNFELVAYCPIGIEAVQHVWDLEDIEITTVCLDQNITNGGEITGGPFSYCLDSGPFFLPSIGLFFNDGPNNTWVLTDGSGTILALPDDIEAVDFAALGGTVYVQNLAYLDGLNGLAVGNNVSDLGGTSFSFSNSFSVTATLPAGGTVEGGPFSFCVDGEADFVSDVSVTGNLGAISQWVVTDDTGIILGLPANIEDVNFDAAGEGSCFIYNVSYEDITNLTAGADIDDLDGCFELSNGILVERLIVESGSLEGGPYEFCIDDMDDFISDVTFTAVDESLINTWIITDDELNILGVPADPTEVNFNETGVGVCFLWVVSSIDVLVGAEVDNSVSDIVGCFGISNSIQISRIDPQGGTLEGGPFEFCVDGIADMVSGVTLTGATGENNQWIVTNGNGRILELTDNIEDVNFDDLGGGIRFIRNISYTGEVVGLEIGGRDTNIEGCLGLSNRIRIDMNVLDGGTLEGGPFSFCVDGIQDTVSNITLSGSEGDTNAWIVTDADGVILGLPDNIEDVNFDEAGVGSCLIWNVSSEGAFEGLELGANISDLTGCIGLSNSILVDRLIIEGGTLEGGPFEFCIDDVDDFISDIELTNVDASLDTTWLVTDAQLNILGIPADPTAVNFNDAGLGVCFVWAVSSNGPLGGLEIDNNVSDITGCYAISNSIQVSRINPNGGTLEGGPFEFCVDGTPDVVSGITLTDADGEINQWIVTDDQGTILGLPADIEIVDFDAAGVGVCYIWNISSMGELSNLEMNGDLEDIGGCFGLSDSIPVVRSMLDGGTLEGGPFDFCVDGIQDTVSNITLTGNEGTNSSWIVTDEDGVILGLPGNIESVDFDAAGGGTCFIYNISFQDGLTGLEMGTNIDTLSGCFGISNSIAVNRTNPLGGVVEGGPFEFCLDDNADLVTGVSVAGNSGANSSWLVTDTSGVIIAVTNEIDTLDFNGAVEGVCLIWNISYASGIEGLEAGEAVDDLEGCFAISENNVLVDRTEVESGTLEGGPYSFCLDDEANFVTDLSLDGNVGANSTFLVTDADGNILEITTQVDTIDFNGTPPGVCLIWNISFEDGLTGLTSGENVSGLEGCFAISNSVSVTRSAVDGGVLTSPDFNFMVDGTPDFVSGIEVSDTIGNSFGWIVTDANLEILGLPGDIENVDFDEAGVGICLIWYVAFDGLTGLEVGNTLNDLEGCFDLSNSITVNRMASAGGVLAGGPFNFCVDGSPDMVSGLTITGAMGTNSGYVVTTDQDSILGLPLDIEDVDFDAAGVGTCFIYHIVYEDNLMGLELGNFLTDLSGGFALSNAVVVNRTQPNGGTLTGSVYNFCLDDNDDFITDLDLTGNQGSNTQWIITDATDNIITVVDDIETINFNEVDAGTYNIYSITYEDGINGLISQSPLSIVDGCFNLSNSVEVVVTNISGGTLDSASFNFCVDTEIDTVSNIILAGATGANNAWVVTDEDGMILGLPENIEDVDFNAAGVGICLIWNVSFEGTLDGLAIDNNISDFDGCYDLSNSITVTRSQPMAGTIEGGPFSFTIDGIEDNATGISLNGNDADNEQWIITTPMDTILALADDIEDINFDMLGVGECFISHIGFADGTLGLSEGNALDEIEGCFDISNSIMVTKMPSIGGSLSGGPFVFCIDGESDFVEGLEIMDNAGTINSWIVAAEDGTIIELANNIEVVDFEDQGIGTTLIYHISYDPMITGLDVDGNISGIMGTFGLSNPIEVVGSTPEAGTLTGGPFEFCLNGDTLNVTDVVLENNVGVNTSWIITDNAGVIIGLPDTLTNVNFGATDPGICLIYSVSYNDGLEGLAIDSLLNNLDGCFALTNSITVERTDIDGGVLTGGPFNFCIDDTPDNLTGISLTDFVGPNINWVVTDENGNITNIVESLGEVDFNEAGLGTSFVYNIAYETGITGFVVNASIDNLEGCFDLSDPITVNTTSPSGGVISGNATTFCVDDDQDFVTDFTVAGATGTNFSWLITDMDGEIFSVPEDILDVNFNSFSGGTYLVWHIAFEDGLDGLFLGEDVSDLEGCFDISVNNIMVTIIEPRGGILSPISYSFCKDGMADFVTGLSLIDTVGVNFDWVITDLTGEILNLPDDIETFDFDEADLGTCLIYNLTSEDGLTGLEIGENIDDLDGCFDLSNSAQVIKEDCVLMTNDSIVINEVFADDSSIELKNVGTTTIDISQYWLTQFPIIGQLTNLPLDCNPSDYILEPGEVVVLIFNGDMSPGDGEMALYNDEIVNPFTDFAESDYIVDYVEWGSSNHTRSVVAVEAGIWTMGDFVPAFSVNNSIEYDGFGDSPFDWTEDSSTLCTDNNFNNPDPVELSITVFPNPVNNEINLDFSKRPTEMATIRVYDAFGKLIIQENVDAMNGETPNVDISQLNEGAYILQVSMKGFSESKRFIKIN